MDNITHSLIGLAVGDAVACARKKQRVPLWIASALANNLPDLDVALTSTIFPGKLGYLLHHRGHTHTLLLAPLLGCALLAILYLFWRKKQDMPWREICFVVLLGSLLHVFADYFNSYGVHPFWPWENRWFYGDFLFIVEPWVWVLLIPPLLFRASSRVARGIFLFLLLGILGLSFYHPAVPLPLALVLTAVAFALLAVEWARVGKAGSRVILGLGLLGVLLLGFAGIKQNLYARYGQKSTELILQPLPANPLCWSAISIHRTTQAYEAALSVLAPWPKLQAATTCPLLFSPELTAPLQIAPLPDSPERRWLGVFVAPVAELEALGQTCQGNAFLRFTRAPYWIRQGSHWIVGDLRFDRQKELSFGEMEFSEEEICPSGVPPWVGRFHPEAGR